MDELRMKFNDFIHPNMEAISRREEFLKDREDVININLSSGMISAEISGIVIEP